MDIARVMRELKQAAEAAEGQGDDRAESLESGDTVP
jgi:hypothetical protein